MEIEQFIEEDIRRYLDARQAEFAQEPGVEPPLPKDGVLAAEDLGLYAPAKDYSADLDAALHEHDLSKAKRILQELKERFDSFPEDAPEKGELKRVFDQLYRTFQEAVAKDKESQEAFLEEELRELPPPKPSPAKTPAPERASLPVTSSEPAPPKSSRTASPPPAQSAPRPPQRLTEDEERALEADIMQAETLLDEHAYTAAIKAYRKLRRNVFLEHMDPEQRARYLPRIKGLYARIGELLVRKAEQPPAPARPSQGQPSPVLPTLPSPSVRVAPRPEPAARHRLTLHLRSAEEAADADDIAEAMEQYHKARMLYDELPPDEGSKRRLQELYGRIARGRRASPATGGRQSARSKELIEREERRLTGTSP